MNSALEKAKKIAVTDGITRTMKQFGSQIGGVYKNTMKKVIEQQNEETNPFPMVHSLKRKKNLKNHSSLTKNLKQVSTMH